MSASPIRIGINAQKLSTSQSYHAAGSSRYVTSLLRELRRLQPPEHIVAYVADRELPSDLTPTATFEIRTPSWPTRRASLRIAWEQLQFPRQLRHDGITVLHGAVNALPVGWRGSSVVTILDLTFLLMPHAFNRANSAYLRWMARFCARRADRIITISESTRRDVVRLLGVDPERVVRVYCGVDERIRPAENRAEVEAFRAEHDLGEGYILYLGTIEPRKNLVRLIDAYAEVVRRGTTNLPLVLAGGRGWDYDSVFRRAVQTGLGDRIRFVGYVPEPEMSLWYNAADLFVYVSEYEGFGLPPLEALASGTPVIASNCSSLPEVMDEAGLLVDPTDTAAIADAMQRVLEDSRLRSRLAAGGPKQAGRFTWARTAEETLAVYRSVSEAA